MSDLTAYVAALETALAELRKTRAYAFANSHQCSTGSDPRLDWVEDHAFDLAHMIGNVKGEG